MTTKANRIERYYDTHEMEGAELTESLLHHELILYLTLVIRWIFHGRNVGVTGNVNFYQTDNPNEPGKSPDIAVVEGLERNRQKMENISSYYVGEDGPPPLVVFEISSKETWRQDLEDKPDKYEAMGVREYFVFDPNTHTIWTGQWRGFRRLVGWRKNSLTGKFELLKRNPDGRMWSEELQSWLAVDGTDLQLFSANGLRRLTKDEADTWRADRETRLKEEANHRAEVEASRAEAEASRADTEARLKEEAIRQAKEESQKSARLAEQLRKLGIDPDA